MALNLNFTQLVIRASATGLLNGRGENMIQPTATATRAEVATILMRFCENIAK